MIPRRTEEELPNATTATSTQAQAQTVAISKKRGSKPKGSPARQGNGAIPASSETEAPGKKWKLPEIGPLTGKGKTLSKGEAADLKESFRESLSDDFEYLDQWLRSKTGNPDLVVWSDVDEEEVEKVTDVFLKGAQRSPVLATVVRETVNTHDYIVVGMVFLPRVQATVKALKQARATRPKQPARWERLRQRRAVAMNGASS